VSFEADQAVSDAAGASGSVADLVRSAGRTAGGSTAFVAPGTTLTWSQVDDLVDATAAGLLRLGLVPGDRVALHLGNVPDFPVGYFGALRAGLVVVPVNTGYTAEEIGHLLRDSGARALLTSPAGRSLTAELAPVEHLVVAGGDGPGSLTALQAGPYEPVPSGAAGEDLAVLLYTSGTSGRPKGAMLSHRALLANLEQASRVDPAVVVPGDVVLLVLPLFHVYGLNAALGMVARQAATGVLVERFDPVETLADLRRHGVTCLVGAPPMYLAWSMLPELREAFAGVRLAVSGAAPLPAEVLHRVLDATGHPVFEGYGLTETAPALTSTLMSEVAVPGSIGRPLPGVELRLLDDAGHEVEEGDPGEIVVRGANLFSGYWPDGAGGPAADGWWPTGDVAYADAAGDLHLVDRRRELILVSGFNVYPREVEDVLTRHPAVREAAVIGVPHPYTGESVKALVVAEDGARPAADDVIAFCARSLARFKCPTAVEVVDSLPHSATGKVSKGRLRELAGG
jgi:long-chain acyl-CoA synthetase